MGLYIKRSKLMLALTALIIVGLFVMVLAHKATWAEVGVMFGMWILPSLFGRREEKNGEQPPSS